MYSDNKLALGLGWTLLPLTALVSVLPTSCGGFETCADTKSCPSGDGDEGETGGAPGEEDMRGQGGDPSSSMGEGGGSDLPKPPNVPVPGASGLLTLSDQTFTQVTLSWEPAFDEETDAEALEYRVIRSLLDDIGTLEEALASGEALTEFEAGLTSVTVELEGGVDNYLNVIVRDGDGHEAPYEMILVAFQEAPTCSSDDDCFSGECRISFRDQDGDGFGVESNSTGRCDGTIPAGYTALSGDCCDDGGDLEIASLIHPGQTEFFDAPANICGISWDYDCSGAVQTSVPSLPQGCLNGGSAPPCYQAQASMTENDCGVTRGAYSCAATGYPQQSCTNAGGTGVLIRCR